ncbi:Serine protease inhibitor 28Dc [Gryllus bimaculatus]|nr:Serine protease inhibitor 28Dc [Gryllus bimaculatus]
MDGALTPERDNAIHQHFGRLLAQLHRRAAATDSSEALSAHGVFVQVGLPLRARFRKVAQQAYHSDVQLVDFVRRPLDAQAAVNAWVKQHTRGRIADMLAQPPPAATRLILATALYFNGQWQHPFPRETTQRRPFYVDGDASGEVLQVEMMANSADLHYAEDPQLRCKILCLPYKGGDVAMYVVLPNERGLHALRALEASLTVEALERLVNSTRLEPDVIVVLPRTKLDFSADLSSALQRLGVHTLFDAGAANLSRLVGVDEAAAAAAGATQARKAPASDAMHFRGQRDAHEPLYVDEILHKQPQTFCGRDSAQVASAATLATVSRDGSHRSVRADRPFIFFIRHQPSGLVLFWGSVVRPRPTPPIV